MQVATDDERRVLAGLIARAAKGDRAAFEAVYHRTSAKLFGIAWRILRDETLSRDILQEAYVKIWQKAADFDPAVASPITWMATIVRNRAIDELRRAKPAATVDADDFDIAADLPDPLDERARSEDLRQLLACLSGLDEERRQILLLAYYRGMSREDLARRFGRPVPTIKTWLHRSLAQLRGCLGS